MILHLNRFVSDSDSTLGILTIDGKFQCFTLEDAYRETKLAGRTRIAAGDYDVKTRKHGRICAAHRRRFGHEHGLEICDVPEFTDVLIHCGNSHEDTRGCILVGATASARPGDMSIGMSRIAYVDLYQAVIEDCCGGSLKLHIQGDGEEGLNEVSAKRMDEYRHEAMLHVGMMGKHVAVRPQDVIDMCAEIRHRRPLP